MTNRHRIDKILHTLYNVIVIKCDKGQGKLYNDYRMSKRQKSLFAADFSAVAKSPKVLFASISLQQKSTNFLSKFVSKSKICSRNSRISTFDCRYNNYRMSKRQKAFSRLIFQPLQKAKNCFLLLYHCNRNRQIPFRNLLANQRFAVEILEFRLSIVVITNKYKTRDKLLCQNGYHSPPMPTHFR